mgnify:CR=1 FL=1
MAAFTAASVPHQLVLGLGIALVLHRTFPGRGLLRGLGLCYYIESILGDERDVDVIIRADADSRNQAMVTAMSVAGELGFTSINLATVTTPGSQ